MALMYSKVHDENLRQRAIILAKSKYDIENQLVIMRHCADDPLFFFNMFLWTYKPKAIGDEWEPEDPNFPFITFVEFQDQFILDVISDIEAWRDNITEKSREMGYSWMLLGISLWWFLFKWWPWLIGSYKEDYVDESGNMDSSFERLRYMLARLPKWMKPHDLVQKYMSISSKTLGCEIAGDSGENFGTGWRRKYVWMDEFALWRADGKAFRKTSDVTNCRIFGWTPEGKFNIYGKIMTNHPDYAHLNIRKYRLHWSKHPQKTQAWYEAQKKKRTRVDVAKELDISYDASVSGAVYPDYQNLVTVKKIEYDVNLRTYTVWDFWRDSNALLFVQKDFRTNQLYIIKTVRKVNWHIEKFLAFVKWEPTQGYSYDPDELAIIEWSKKTINGRYSNHFGDPYNGDAIQTNAVESCKGILARHGIYLTLKSWTTLETRITNAWLALYRTFVNEDESDFNQSMIQSHYPQVKENSQAVTQATKPVHDENSHFRTTYEYLIDNEPAWDPYNPNDSVKVFVNKITGKQQVTQRTGFWLARR